VKIKEYIESGILESYVMGIATEEETKELLNLKANHVEIQHALYELETELESIAYKMAVPPPPDVWLKIEDQLKEVAKRPVDGSSPLKIHSRREERQSIPPPTGQFIEVQGPSSHMRIHKIWRWVFAAVFILGKIFLAFAIYYFLENRQIKEELQETKQRIDNYK